MRIYVASSWRNLLQPSIVAALRECGHDVYDFRNPPNNSGFGWEQVNPRWKLDGGTTGFVEAGPYRVMLAHPIAKAGYQSDIEAVRACDAVVYVLPCGRSASWEFGYIMGQGKPGYVIWFGAHEPELMFRDATIIASMNDLRETFAIPATPQLTGNPGSLPTPPPCSDVLCYRGNKPHTVAVGCPAWQRGHAAGEVALNGHDPAPAQPLTITVKRAGESGSGWHAALGDDWRWGNGGLEAIGALVYAHPERFGVRIEGPVVVAPPPVVEVPVDVPRDERLEK